VCHNSALLIGAPTLRGMCERAAQIGTDAMQAMEQAKVSEQALGQAVITGEALQVR